MTTPADEESTNGELESSKDEGRKSSGSQSEVQGPAGNQNTPPSEARASLSTKLATPAVRHLAKELVIDISHVQGTGKDGRVIKEDLQKYHASSKSIPSRIETATREDRIVNLTPVESQMFKAMSRSLSIPQFLYTEALDMTHVESFRRSINASNGGKTAKITLLSFIVKAVSLAMLEHSKLNARIQNQEASDRPQLVIRGHHNIGVAVDTPQGLVVPVIRAVESLSITETTAELVRLSQLARDGKLAPTDFERGSFTVSNIGSIGGDVVSPIIVEGQVAILGVGRIKAVPAFDADGKVVKREQCVFSWSADHRVVDGATVSKCGQAVKEMLENPLRMLLSMR